MTPNDVHTSVSRCLPSAVRVTDRWDAPARQAQPDALQCCRVKKSLHRGDQDERRRDEDHQSFDPRREVLGLAMAEVVVIVSGSRRNVQGDQRDHSRDQVHAGLGGVREEADRPGQQVSPRLQPDRQQSRRDRKPRELGQSRGSALGLGPHLGKSDLSHAATLSGFSFRETSG
jgi:hypothetical protein